MLPPDFAMSWLSTPGARHLGAVADGVDRDLGERAVVGVVHVAATAAGALVDHDAFDLGAVDAAGAGEPVGRVGLLRQRAAAADIHASHRDGRRLREHRPVVARAGQAGQHSVSKCVVDVVLTCTSTTGDCAAHRHLSATVAWRHFDVHRRREPERHTDASNASPVPKPDSSNSEVIVARGQRREPERTVRHRSPRTECPSRPDPTA